MSFTMGSLFDGSGGFPLAAFMCGGIPKWASEIEPYPIAVTKSRFPYMIHLGDVAKVKGNEIEPVDVITFGSPCQDLSVAGKRAGLKHEDNGDDETTRSGLFMEAIRIIKEMREATNGRYPTFALWENVPGAFSSNKGEDFRIVLEELIKIVEPTAVMPTVPKNGWSYADYYCGDGWSLAYRVFDAQYIRTAQRRRRIYLVLDLRGERAREVLFERESLRGYFETGRAQGEGITSDAERGVVPNDCERNCVIESGGFKEHNSPEARTIGFELEKSPTLSATKHDASTVYCIDGDKLGKAERAGGSGLGIRDGDTMYTLTVKDVHCVCYDARGNGDGKVSPTITGDHNNRITDYTTIVLDRAFYNQGQNALYEPQYYEDGIVPPIVAKGPSAVAYGINGNVAGTLDASYYKGCGMRQGVERDVVAEYWDGSQTCGTLTARNAGGAQRMPDKENFNCVVQTEPQYIVRRLTPTECSRLQGFMDGWSVPDKKDDFTDEEYEFWLNVRNTHAEINGKQTKDYNKKQMLSWYNKLHTDSAEYKMWGNGIAFPCALYVMQGIEDVLH